MSVRSWWRRRSEVGWDGGRGEVGERRSIRDMVYQPNAYSIHHQLIFVLKICCLDGGGGSYTIPYFWTGAGNWISPYLSFGVIISMSKQPRCIVLTMFPCEMVLKSYIFEYLFRGFGFEGCGVESVRVMSHVETI